MKHFSEKQCLTFLNVGSYCIAGKEAGFSDELSLRQDFENSPSCNTTTMLGNDSIDYKPSAGVNCNLPNEIRESEKLQTSIDNLKVDHQIIP